MPKYGVPGYDPLQDILELIAPAIGSAIYNLNQATRPVRDYYSPVLGLARDFGIGSRRLGGQVGALARQGIQDFGERTTRGIQEAMTTAFDTAHGEMPYTIPESLRPRFNTPQQARQRREQPFVRERQAIGQAIAPVSQAAQLIGSYFGDIIGGVGEAPAWLLQQMRRPVNGPGAPRPPASPYNKFHRSRTMLDDLEGGDGVYHWGQRPVNGPGAPRPPASAYKKFHRSQTIQRDGPEAPQRVEYKKFHRSQTIRR